MQPKQNARLEPLTPADKAQGFTLLELLAIVIVLCLMLPLVCFSLAGSRTSTTGFQCLNNHRQLVNAWRMYADDNQGRLVYNTDGGWVGHSPTQPAWAGGWLDLTSSTDNTNTALLINHDFYPYSAFLGPYIKSPRPFKCPADGATVPMWGQNVLRVRSVSMNNFVGELSRTWTTKSRYCSFTNLAQVKSPSRIWFFLDEREDSINDEWFVTDPDVRYQIVDYPAAYHGSAAGFSFIDGHAEIHVWTDARTVPPFDPNGYLLLNINLPGDSDIDWLQQHASELK